MPRTALRLLITFGLALGVSSATAWANHNGQEDICHSAAVIFCENFEDRVVGFIVEGNAAHIDITRAKYKNAGWEAPFASGRMGVQTTQAREGTKSFETNWPAGRLGSVGYLLSSFFPGYRDLYFRVYSFFSTDYTISPVGNRQFALVNTTTGGGVTGAVHTFTNQFGSVAPSHKTTRQQLDWIQLYQNVGSTSYAPNTWYCQEIHVRQSTGVNQANGLVEGWIDDVQRWNYPNQIILDHVEPMTQVWFDGRYNCPEGEADNGTCLGTDSGGAHPAMSRWHDAFVISTQRIGCLGGAPPPPGDTTPPLPPTKLQVSSLWDQLLKLV